MENYKIFKSFDSNKWVEWIECLVYRKYVTPNLGYVEIKENLYAAFDYLVEEKKNPDAFNVGLIAIINKIPKKSNYAFEIYQLIDFAAYSKPEKEVGTLEKMLFARDLQSLEYDSISLQDLLISVLCTFINIDHRSYDNFFISGITKKESPNFILGALRYYYKLLSRKKFFKYLHSIVENYENDHDYWKYIDNVNYALIEMTDLHHNYEEVFYWWVNQQEIWEKLFPNCFSAFVELGRDWLNKKNEQTTTYPYAELLGATFFSTVIEKDDNKPGIYEVISLMKASTNEHISNENPLISFNATRNIDKVFYEVGFPVSRLFELINIETENLENKIQLYKLKSLYQLIKRKIALKLPDDDIKRRKISMEFKSICKSK